MIGLVFHITSEDMSTTVGHKCNGTSRLAGLIVQDWGRIVLRLGANCPETGGESSGANCCRDTVWTLGKQLIRIYLTAIV